MKKKKEFIVLKKEDIKFYIIVILTLGGLIGWAIGILPALAFR